MPFLDLSCLRGSFSVLEELSLEGDSELMSEGSGRNVDRLDFERKNWKLLRSLASMYRW